MITWEEVAAYLPALQADFSVGGFQVTAKYDHLVDPIEGQIPVVVEVNSTFAGTGIDGDSPAEAVADLANFIVEVIHGWSISWPECPNHHWPMAAGVEGDQVVWNCVRAADVQVPLGTLQNSSVASRSDG